MNRLIEIIESGYLDGSAEPLALGTVTSYLAGTSTLQVLYQDFALTTPHANPLTLSAEGRATAYSGTRVKLVFKTAAGATVRTVDNVGTADSDLAAATATALAGDGLVAPGDGTLAINPDGDTLELSSDELRVKDRGLSLTKLDLTTNSDWVIKNLIVVASVGSNALTFSIKSRAGTDCSATDFASIPFRSATLTSAALTLRTLTAALSDVIASGSTLGHVSATEWPIYVYLLDNAGTLKIAYSTSPVDERFLQTTVDENGNGDSVSALYADDVYANVAVRLVAVFKSTQTTAGTWAAVPTAAASATAGNRFAALVARPSHTTVGVGGVAISDSSGNYSTTSTSTTNAVTNLSVTISTSGRPVRILLQPEGGTSNSSRLGMGWSSGTTAFITIRLWREGSPINQWLPEFVGLTGAPCSYKWTDSLDFIDLGINGTPGTYTYSLIAFVASPMTAYFQYLKMVAYEI